MAPFNGYDCSKLLIRPFQISITRSFSYYGMIQDMSPKGEKNMGIRQVYTVVTCDKYVQSDITSNLCFPYIEVERHVFDFVAPWAKSISESDFKKMK